MYRTCITCGASLQENAVLEHFPVGRRVAFDAHRGRLWVVCLQCRCWNLAPIEERWEAVEEAETAFEKALIGAATEHVTLGRVPEGLEMVRVGPARSVEFAGWRYGDALVGRYERDRKRGRMALGASFAAAWLGGPLAPIASGGLVAWWGGMELLYQHRSRRIIHRRSPEGAPPELLVPIRGRDIHRTRLVLDEAAANWELRVPRMRGDLVLAGAEGIRVARRMLPFMNRKGAKVSRVESAVRLAEGHGDPETLFRYAALTLGDGNEADQVHGRVRFRKYRIASAHPVMKTALEIAANDETERRALAGELALLEREWREAEELAGIIDDLLLPRTVLDGLRRLKEGRRS